MDELHAGDAGADHHEVLGQRRRRVGVAGGQDAVAVDARPSRGCGAGSRWPAGRRRPRRSHRAVGRVGHDLVGPVEPARAPQDAHALAVEERRVPCSSRCSMPAMRARRASRSTLGLDLGEAHLQACGRRTPWRRRWRSWPWTGCSPRGGRRRRSTSCSTSVTSAPSRAAWVAAVLPAGPPPMITKRTATRAQATDAVLAPVEERWVCADGTPSMAPAHAEDTDPDARGGRWPRRS